MTECGENREQVFSQNCVAILARQAIAILKDVRYTRVWVAFTDQHGEHHRVRSKLLLMRMGDGIDSLTAVIYVDPNDPDKYQL